MSLLLALLACTPSAPFEPTGDFQVAGRVEAVGEPALDPYAELLVTDDIIAGVKRGKTYGHPSANVLYADPYKIADLGSVATWDTKLGASQPSVVAP